MIALMVDDEQFFSICFSFWARPMPMSNMIQHLHRRTAVSKSTKPGKANWVTNRALPYSSESSPVL